jgi:hypothetical protein
MATKNSSPEDLCALAVSIIQKHFSAGLTNICDPHFLARRYNEFLHRDDPIYVRLLQGMGDEALSKTFVSYWTIAQTLATQSRFWLEDALAEIITAQVLHFGRKATHVYSYRMLANGDLEQNIAVADLGESRTEHLSERRPWRPLMKENALREVDILVGEEERERVHFDTYDRRLRRRRWNDGRARANDEEQLMRIARAVGGRAIADVAIQCNLLVVEPDQADGKPHAFAFRFINPKTFSSHAQRKQERVNLLRLYAYLVQEKPFRQPADVHVCVAELLPRLGTSVQHIDPYSDYFSPLTYSNCDDLWRFVGVPFDVVEQAITNVAQQFREQLKEGLTNLLPGSHPPPGWGTEKRSSVHPSTPLFIEPDSQPGDHDS